MWERVIVGIALLAHGFVHFRAWWIPMPGSDVRSSWLLGRVPAISVGLATVAAGSFVVAGAALIGDMGWWPLAALVASGVSMLLILLVFNRWLLIAVGLDALVVWYAVRGLD